MSKTTIIDGKEIPRLRYVGTSWYKRGFPYWLRRARTIILMLVILIAIAGMSSALFAGMLSASNNSVGFRAVVIIIYLFFTATCFLSGYQVFLKSSIAKRDQHTEADRRRWRLLSRFSKRADSVFSSAARVPIQLLMFFLGGGGFITLLFWLILSQFGEYSSKEEFAAVRAIQGLPPIDFTELFKSWESDPGNPIKDKPQKLPLLGRSWAKRGAWYWTRRVLWTGFFGWTFVLAALICVQSIRMCAEGGWLRNRALAVGLALLPVIGSLFVGARSLWSFRQLIGQDQKLGVRADQWRRLRWISQQQRAIGGVGGLLVFSYLYHDPTARLMHAGRGSSRHFAMFMLLFVVGIAFAWALACFFKYFGPEEYDAVQTVKYLADFDARAADIHKASELTEAEKEYRRDAAWRPPVSDETR